MLTLMLASTLSLALASGSAETADQAQSVSVYVGTYTSENGSKGIYHLRFDPNTGALSNPELAAELSSPSYVAVHPNGRFLYAVKESSGGDTTAFEILPDRSLKELNTQSAKGGGPCHVSLHPTGRALYVSAYGGGTLASLPVGVDGKLEAPNFHFQNRGTGPNKSRQEAPHMHFAQADPTGKHVYACDLGTDEVLVYRFAGAAGLQPADPKAAKIPDGGGPRHLAFSNDGKFVFVNNEMTSAVTSFARSLESGALTRLSTVSTLPAGADGGGNSTAAIAVHPSGKWLYVSNRGHDSIAVFAIGSNGDLKMVESFRLPVSTPRSFRIDPSGKWVLVAGQKSGDLVALRLDPSTGKLSETRNRVKIDRPVCVVFAP